MNKIDLTGKVFSRITVIKENGRCNSGKPKWDCVCECGNTMNLVGANILSGTTKSCGCLQKEKAGLANSTHGLTGITEYYSWVNMKTRCYNPNSEDYKDYGGRGITVCDRWINSFENFISDMKSKPKGMSLDRVDPNGNYEPSNCKWSTLVEQARNKRKITLYETAGLKMILQDWANYFGVHQANLMVSIKSKGIDAVYDFYFVKYNGVFPNGEKVTNTPALNYNKPKPIIAIKETLPIIVEAKSVRDMSRQTKIHHAIIENSIAINKPYKGWAFEFL